MKASNIFWVVVCILGVAYLFNQKTVTEKVEVTKTLPAPTSSAPESGTFGTKLEGVAFKEEFMKNCVGGAATVQYCSCAYSYLQKHYTMEELAKIDEMTELQVKQFLMPAVNACSEYIGSSTAL